MTAYYRFLRMTTQGKHNSSRIEWQSPRLLYPPCPTYPMYPAYLARMAWSARFRLVWKKNARNRASRAGSREGLRKKAG
jgi:hypothetical protein